MKRFVLVGIAILSVSFVLIVSEAKAATFTSMNSGVVMDDDPDDSTASPCS